MVRFWRFNRERCKLTGIQCADCGSIFLAPRLICPRCRGEMDRVTEEVFPTLKSREVLRSGGAPQITVTVLIPAYNAADTIRATLSSLYAQDLDEPFEIIVVDSSVDQTPAIVAEEFPRTRLIHREERADPGTARNLGIAQARGKIIACIDADCIAPPDWLSRMVSAQRAGHSVVGGTVENAEAESLIAWAGYLGEFREWLPVGQPRVVKHVPTCNISYHRSVFSESGGFPTGFYPQEDMLYHWRLSRRGVPIWFDPSIRVRHVHRSTWRSYSRHLRRIGRATARVLDLTSEEGAFLARSPVLALLAVPVLPWVKWLRTIGVFLSHQPHVLRKHALALLPFLLGLFVWAIGFAEGSWAPALPVSLRDGSADVGGSHPPPTSSERPESRSD